MQNYLKNIDVFGIENVLLDILLQVKEEDLNKLGLKKGTMHLVDEQFQRNIFNKFNFNQLNTEVGGSALNTIRILAKLGIKTGFFGMIGNDEFGSIIKTKLENLGIKVYLGTKNNISSGTSIILITPEGERTMNTCLGASSYIEACMIPYEEIKKSKILHISGYQWCTPHQKEAAQMAIKQVKSFDTKISFDIADPTVVIKYREDFLNIIQNYADILYANEEEIKILYNKHSLDECLKECQKYNTLFIIKLGSKGAIIQNKHQNIYINSYAVKVIDTTAAGDSFAAGFLYGFIKNLPLEECGKIAAEIAADVVSRIGAKVSDNLIKEIKARYN